MRTIPFLAWAVASVTAIDLPLKLETRSGVRSRVTNVHFTSDGAQNGVATVVYGSCTLASPQESHHAISEIELRDAGSQRLVWVIPEDAPHGGCISAFGSSGILLGRSVPQNLQHEWKEKALRKRALDPITMTNETGFDVYGTWFEAVELLQNAQPGAVDVSASKNKDIVIVGAGMSGLMTYLLLSQAGFTNLSIVEASERLGGRIDTEYLTGGPADYSYQEMGPMRFPWTYTDTTTNTTFNISDHQVVYQVAEELNELNNHDKNLSVEFIPWLETSNNGLQYYNGFKLPSGLPPTLAQAAVNSSLVPPTNYAQSTTELFGAVLGALDYANVRASVAKNTFKAHSEFLKSGLSGQPAGSWSEFGYMVNYLKGTLNDTEILAKALGEVPSNSFWYTLFEGTFLQATSMKTIDGGLNRLPLAFHPIVDNITTFGRAISRVNFLANSNQVQLQWRNDSDILHINKSPTFQSSTHDYAVISVPFSVVKNWRLPSTISPLLKRAITNLNYDTACKVALEFSERFWEHYENPIYGGCSTDTDIPEIGSICYPSYNINATGPASIIATYTWGNHANRWISVPETEHVAYALDSMAEIHGESIRALFTGNYKRKCWLEDPLAAGGWASPTAGQTELYMPEYFKTHSNMIFVGEHTAQINGWVAAALESGIRGAVQLMLELGLVDEAQDAVDKWMARWIDI